MGGLWLVDLAAAKVSNALSLYSIMSIIKSLSYICYSHAADQQAKVPFGECTERFRWGRLAQVAEYFKSQCHLKYAGWVQ
jgi:hypothetical protein